MTVPLQTRIDESNFTKLKKAADNKGLSVSMLLRIIIIEFLERLLRNV